MLTILDGPLGTELDRRGVVTEMPSWSATAIEQAPDVIAAIHRDYAMAGATVHTANTFRTKRRTLGDRWEALTHAAVRIARDSVPTSHRVAGSIAPLEDCYRPDLSPPESRAEHREMARALADAGCDILLCETFPHVGEAIVAVEEAVQTGLETWLALTAGPNADLLSPQEMTAAAGAAIGRGATAILVNCTPAESTLLFIRQLADDFPQVRIGAYANAGSPDNHIGWSSDSSFGAEKYSKIAKKWIEAGATLIGGCCGTGPAHIASISRACGNLPGSRQEK